MKRFKDLKIATKLTVIFMGVAALLTLGAGYLAIRISSQQLISQIEERYRDEVKDHMLDIDILMDRNYHHIQSFAQNEVFTRGGSTPEEMTAFLKKRKETYGYASLSYFDMNRVRIADTEGLHLGEQHQMVRYWQDVLAGRVSAGSDVRVAEELKVPIIYFASSVKNKEGKAVGAVVARFNPEEIARVVEDIGKRGVDVTLIDRDRNILFSSSEKLKPLVLKEKISELPSVKSALSGQNGVILEYLPYYKKEFFTTYAHERGWHDFKGNDWSLLISVEKDKVLAPLGRLKVAIIGIALGVLLIVFIIASLVANSFSKPILQLAQAAQRIGKGDLALKDIKITSADEIGQLAHAFNQMAEEIKKSQGELELQSWGLAKANEGIKVLYKELEQRSEEVKRLLQVKSHFTSMVSHELRTPLAALKEGVSLVSEGIVGTVNPEQKRFLDIAKSNVDRLARLINEILDFQSLSSGKVKYKLEETDINAVIQEVREVMISLAEEKDLDFLLRLGDNLPKIKIDRDKIIQVLTNLVNNALKFIEKGGITIATGRGDNFIQVSVKDTGPGMRKEDMPKLFQQFVQLERRTGGSGLGLAICKEIIEAHGGKIWAESEFGQGTTFHFVLPIEERRRQI